MSALGAAIPGVVNAFAHQNVCLGSAAVLAGVGIVDRQVIGR